MPTETNLDRVQLALQEKSFIIEQNLSQYDIQKDQLNILIVAFKDEEALYIYAKNKMDAGYTKIKSYPICARSGDLGPKKAEGDKQVPEGFYHIDRFNPKSKFYLSLGLNYPNELDSQLNYTGSDIFIHGKCQTTGCLPMTDELMKEIYIYALWAKEAGQQQIPIYIFPFEMTNANMQKHRNNLDKKTVTFWENLQEGYHLFHTKYQELGFYIEKGKYIYNQ